MKNTGSNLKICLLMILTLLSLFTSCKKEDDIQNNPNPPNTDVDGTDTDADDSDGDEVVVDFNKIAAGLKFRNSSIIPGDIPKSSSSGKGIGVNLDFKIDTDTIFWTDGVINRVKIKKPLTGLTGAVTSFYGKVDGSDNYIKADFETEQENDTLIVLNFDLDTSSLELPLLFDITIVPFDPSGEPYIDDRVRIPVLIELGETGGACDFAIRKNLGNREFVWEWIHTWNGGALNNAPMQFFSQSGDLQGCCRRSDNTSEYGQTCSFYPISFETVILDYKNSYHIRYDYFDFYTANTIRGRLSENSKNISAERTNFCDELRIYIDNNKSNDYHSDDVVINQSDCTFTIGSLSGDIEVVNGQNFPLPIYMSSGPNNIYKLLSKHFIQETRENREGNPNGGVIRTYIRRNWQENENRLWYALHV